MPEVVVPDQLRSAVSGPDRYEPDINPTYLEMAQHYGVTVIPGAAVRGHLKLTLCGHQELTHPEEGAAFLATRN